MKNGGVSAEVNGDDVVSFLSTYLEGSALLFFDTCNAASIAPLLELPRYQATAAVFGSAADESALEFPIDRATRLALTLHNVIRSLSDETDIGSLAVEVERRIRADLAMAAQTVSYLPARPTILLSKTSASHQKKVRSRTYVIVRSLLVSVGIALTCLIAIVLWYLRVHVQVEVVVPLLAVVDGPISVEVRRQSPDLNKSDLIETDVFSPLRSPTPV